jgi:hypothetical protein
VLLRPRSGFVTEARVEEWRRGYEEVARMMQGLLKRLSLSDD